MKEMILDLEKEFQTKHFGKMKLTGNKQKEQGKRPKYEVMFLETGNKCFASWGNIKSGQVRDKTKKTVSNVGYAISKTKKDNVRLYHVWSKMLKRCYHKESKDYKHYGEKGTKVEERWHCFDYFLEDVVKIEGWDENLLNDKKIELDKDKKFLLGLTKKREYSRETCTWISAFENKMIKPSYFGNFKATDPKGNVFYFKSIAVFAKEHNLNSKNISAVLRKRQKTTENWKFEKIENLEEIV